MYEYYYTYLTILTFWFPLLLYDEFCPCNLQLRPVQINMPLYFLYEYLKLKRTVAGDFDLSLFLHETITNKITLAESKKILKTD